MAIGKANININLNKLSIKLGPIKIIEKGQLLSTYNENDAESLYERRKKN